MTPSSTVEGKAGLEAGSSCFQSPPLPLVPMPTQSGERHFTLRAEPGGPTRHTSHVTPPQVLLTALGGIHNLRFGRLCPPNALASLLHLGNTEGDADASLGFEGAELGGGAVGTLGPALSGRADKEAS